MCKVAVLIDGGFLQRVFTSKRSTPTQKAFPSADDVINIAKMVIQPGEKLFRLYYYDCPPFEDTTKNPISNITVNHARSPKCRAIKIFQEELAQKEHVAFRKGDLRCFGWKLSDIALQSIERGTHPGTINPADLIPNFQQKGLDMRIGLDIAVLSTKRIVEKIAIITADTDFIPAMKYARKEGTIIAVVDIGSNLRSDMKHHADEIIKIDLTQYTP